jgi:DNA replication licensing factor MCM6
MSNIRSSPRPQGPPSESNGAYSDAEGPEGLEEVVRARRPNDRAPPPKVVDEVGERVGEVFATFLETHVLL